MLPSMTRLYKMEDGNVSYQKQYVISLNLKLWNQGCIKSDIRLVPQTCVCWYFGISHSLTQTSHLSTNHHVMMSSIAGCFHQEDKV